MPSDVLIAIAAAAAFVAVHLFVGAVKFLSGTPRSRWLSIAGGVSVAYVFLHLLPELSEGQRVLSEAAGSAIGYAERHVYLIALAGLVIFYGVERLANRSSGRDSGTPRAAGGTGVFSLHLGSFAVYNIVIGYLLLHREKSGSASLASFAVAMALHFLVSDYGLREHHRARYDRVGRAVLSAAVLLGLLLGFLVDIQDAMIVVLVAFIAGGVILNVMKEELPKERESRFSAFLVGVVLYSVLLAGL